MSGRAAGMSGIEANSQVGEDTVQSQAVVEPALRCGLQRRRANHGQPPSLGYNYFLSRKLKMYAITSSRSSSERTRLGMSR
jgi:hypothetical protein